MFFFPWWGFSTTHCTCKDHYELVTLKNGKEIDRKHLRAGDEAFNIAIKHHPDCDEVPLDTEIEVTKSITVTFD